MGVPLMEKSPTVMWARIRIAEIFAVTVFLLLSLMLAGHAQAKPSSKNSKKDARPNIVFVQADDAIVTDIPYMPNVRRVLQRGGTSFGNNIAPYPLCGPARASLLTGQLAHNNDLLSNFRSNEGGYLKFKEQPGKLNQRNSLGPWLHQAGYRTGMVGKYLNEYGAESHTDVPPGWDRWAALLDNSTYDYFNYAINVDGKVQYHGDKDYADAQLNFAHMGATDTPTSFAELLASAHAAFDPYDYFGTQDEKQYSMDITGDIASKFVKKSAPSKKPFFLYYAPPGPHAEDTNHFQGLRPGAPDPDPRPPVRYAHTFDNISLPQTPSFNEADVTDKAENLKNTPLLTEGQIATMTDSYRGRLGALRSVDDQVGKIIKDLKKAGEYRNTYFIFNSDNGYMQGQHRLRSSKFLPYEYSARIPALISGPGIRKGQTITRQSMDVDMTPTVLDMANARPGRRMDGVSLLPAAEGKKKLPARDIPLEAIRPLFLFTTPITAFDLPYYGVRTSRYKYIHWSFSGTNIELYDLKTDPDELKNLAADPAYSSLVDKLEAKASSLRTCRGTAQCR